MKNISVAVVGATGAVGREMIRALHQSMLPIAKITLFASPRSVGMQLSSDFGNLTIQPLCPGCFRGIDIALFSAGSSVSREMAPRAVAEGAIVIDNSSCWRQDASVPLVVPEVNPAFSHQGIIANPNCSTIQMVVALHPIHKRWGIKRVVVSTYQAVSGSGHRGSAELQRQIGLYPDNDLFDTSHFGQPILNNVIPIIGEMQPDGFTSEEHKMRFETRKILAAPELLVSATTVRVPVFVGHAEAVTLELLHPADPDEVRMLLHSSPGMQVLDDGADRQPMPILSASCDDVMVGRIRRDPVFDNGLSLWIVANNLRKGAALNAVQIAKLLYNGR